LETRDSLHRNHNRGTVDELQAGVLALAREVERKKRNRKLDKGYEAEEEEELQQREEVEVDQEVVEVDMVDHYTISSSLPILNSEISQKLENRSRMKS
jgi:hypothetical protein